MWMKICNIKVTINLRIINVIKVIVGVDNHLLRYAMLEWLLIQDLKYSKVIIAAQWGVKVNKQ